MTDETSLDDGRTAADVDPSPDDDPEQRRPGRRWVRRIAIALAAVVTTLCLIVAVVVALIWQEGRHGAGYNATYVSLGSSFAAGPGVGERAPDSPTLCMRSAENFAHLLAEKRGLDLVDASCGGATTSHVLEGGQYFQPAQIDSVGPDTRLITITIGGNDVNYIGNLFGWACANDADRTPRAWRWSACGTTSLADEQAAFESLEDSLLEIVDAARHRAPEATIVFVDYITVLPQSGSCFDELPLTAGQLERSRQTAGRLQELTADVAARAGVELLEASVLSQDHHVCAADSWVSDYAYPSLPARWGELPYHPTTEAFRAIADELDAMLPQTLGEEPTGAGTS